ncbi:MAG: hypothetical protein HRT67_11445 [Flavobacteriaceae bacterium]|nr:hypothetical protein [Flavobacteriaceae bacterium]
MFPEGQTFQPLEVIESYKVDTTKKDAKYHLIKKYGLTQFDSGRYVIPKQRVQIGDQAFFTDSLLVEVKNVVVDTTKQKLYDIKPIISVKKSPSQLWLYILIGIAIAVLIAFLLYWLIWREKPLTEEEKIAQLPPYDRAKLALKTLDEAEYLKQENIKGYYSDLTLIIRKYLDEKVYDRSLESTTSELIKHLELLKQGNQIDLSKETIKNIESILKRADLVKFAKSKPDYQLAKLDRTTIDVEIDEVKASLPEPTEEELLADEQYQEELQRKNKRKKVLITIGVAVFLLLVTLFGFGLKYGFTYVKDTILGHESKTLLETKEWITSEYGAPGITITTPKVLKRIEVPVPDEFKDKVKVTTFAYGGINSTIDILVMQSKFNVPTPNGSGYDAKGGEEQFKINLAEVAEQQLLEMEKKGAQNIISQNEKFVTPNGQEGLKTFGTAEFKIPVTDKIENGNYIILGFTSGNILQNVILIWKTNDTYAEAIVERMMNSIELLKLEEDDQ